MTDNTNKSGTIIIVIIGCCILLLTGFLIFGKKPNNTDNNGGKNQTETDDDAGKKPEQTYESAPYPRKAKQPKSDEVRLEELKLDPLAGYYMNTPTEEGLTVCVWKCVYGYEPGKGEILCGLLPRQLDKIYNPEPTEDMASMGLGLGGFSPEDMKIILSTFDIPKEKISVIPWSNPADSVGACSRPTTTEVGEVKEYLLGK